MYLDSAHILIFHTMKNIPDTKRVEIRKISFHEKCAKINEGVMPGIHGEDVKDLVINDVPLTIRINDTNIKVSIRITPSFVDEFVVGYLLGEGFVTCVADILNVEMEICGGIADGIYEGIIGGINDGIGNGIREKINEGILVDIKIKTKTKEKYSMEIKEIKSDCRLKKQNIMQFLGKLNEDGTLFRTTGGTHIAALFDVSGKMLVRCEDIGRHNAVDKVIGFACMNEVDVCNTAIVISGRIAGDLAMKIIRAKIPVLISISAPFYSGIELSKRYGLTLIGFARESGFNIYNDYGRII